MKSLRKSACVLLAAVLLSGCTASEAPRLPRESRKMQIEDDVRELQDDASFDATFDVALKRIKADVDNAKAQKLPEPTINILVISGGGDWGAFGTGFLKGWGKSKNPRPQFDFVTGVSTGALIAPFAFLGDEKSIEAIDNLYRNPKKGWLEQRSILSALQGSESFADIPGLEKEMKDNVPLEMIQRIAEEGKKGRGMAVNTTNIDSAEARPFNMTAEAVKCVEAKSPDRFHQILFASSAIPGAFPPRLIDDTLYVDGAVTSNVLYGRPKTKEEDTFLAKWHKTYPNDPIPKIRYWILFNNQLNFPPKVIQPKWSAVLMRSVNTATHAATKVGIRQIFLQAEIARLRYKADVQVNFVSIPNDWKMPKEGFFQQETMRNLSDIGETMGTDPASWRIDPP
jgi:hypothetical protein